MEEVGVVFDGSCECGPGMASKQTQAVLSYRSYTIVCIGKAAQNTGTLLEADRSSPEEVARYSPSLLNGTVDSCGGRKMVDEKCKDMLDQRCA